MELGRRRTGLGNERLSSLKYREQEGDQAGKLVED